MKLVGSTMTCKKIVIMHKSAMGLKPVLIDFGKARPRGYQRVLQENTPSVFKKVIYSLKGYFQTYVRQICSVQLSDAVFLASVPSFSRVSGFL